MNKLGPNYLLDIRNFSDRCMGKSGLSSILDEYISESVIFHDVLNYLLSKGTSIVFKKYNFEQSSTHRNSNDDKPILCNEVYSIVIKKDENLLICICKSLAEFAMSCDDINYKMYNNIIRNLNQMEDPSPPFYPEKKMGKISSLKKNLRTIMYNDDQ